MASRKTRDKIGRTGFQQIFAGIPEQKTFHKCESQISGKCVFLNEAQSQRLLVLRLQGNVIHMNKLGGCRFEEKNLPDAQNRKGTESALFLGFDLKFDKLVF